MNVRLTKEQKERVLNSEGVYKIMKQVLLRENKIRRNQEHLWLIGLDSSNKILFIELVSLGSTNKIVVTPAEIFRMAIYKLAIKIIIVHNHPSGITQPSPEDMKLTASIIHSGVILNIKLIDHLIITEKEYVSLSALGLMDKFGEDSEYSA